MRETNIVCIVMMCAYLPYIVLSIMGGPMGADRVVTGLEQVSLMVVNLVLVFLYWYIWGINCTLH